MQRRSLIAMVTVLVLLAGVRFTWSAIVARPVLDPDQVAAAERSVSDAIADADAHTCPRPVLRGEATPGGAAAYVALLDAAGPFAACWSLLEAEHDDVSAALVAPDGTGASELPAETHVSEEPDDGPPVDPAWTFAPFGRPLHRTPLPIESRVLAACAPVAAEIERIARHASVCTPFPLGTELDGRAMIALARAASVLVRDRMRRGDRTAGFALALDMMRLAGDAGRGRPVLEAAAVSYAASQIVLGQLQLLLASDLPFEDAELVTLERELPILASTMPTPDTWLLDEPVMMVGSSPATPPIDPAALGRRHVALALVPYVDARRGDLTCAPGDTREACMQRWRSEITRLAATSPPPTWRTWLGPRAQRDELVLEVWCRVVEDALPYFERSFQLEASVRALWVAAEARRRHLATGVCPDVATVRTILASEGGTAAMDGFGGTLTAYRTTIDYQPIDVCAPAWLSSRLATARGPVVEIYCPPVPLVP